ncbi:MAG TPA: sugar nucleotide-binding protein [Xanthobacteraceae bacterium]|nr:sugar nucleotide-binding protein [Xanthobacteraceae bacterium]
MRVLVVGGDSLIGAAFARSLAGLGHIVYSTTRRRESVGGSHFYLDLTEDEPEAIALPAVDVVFFCAAVSGFAVCRTNPALARRVNVEGTGRLVRRLVGDGIYAVLLSSTAVFDFQEPYVLPDAPVRPLTVLGQTKAEAERIFLAMGAFGSVLRLTKVVTADAPLFTKWITALRRREQIVAYSDIHIAPISLDDATRAMFAVASDRGPGVYQISGARDVSYFEVALHFATMMRVPLDRVRSERAIDNGIPAAEVPRHTTLESSRIEALTGRAAPDPYQIIETIFEPQITNLGEIEASTGA